MTSNASLSLPNIFKKNQLDKSDLQEKKTPKNAAQLRPINPILPKIIRASNQITKLKQIVQAKEIKTATNPQKNSDSNVQSSPQTYSDHSDLENSPETHRNNAEAVSNMMASLIIKNTVGSQK
jgi:hypothetical protein